MNRSMTLRAELAVTWSEKDARHCDRMIVPKINFWRDLFPDGLAEALANCETGDSFRISFAPGKLVPAHNVSSLRKVHASAFEKTLTKPGIQPRKGRFYPCGVIASAINCFPQDVRPFRVVDGQGDAYIVDLNHPLSEFPLLMKGTVLSRNSTIDERGGSVTDLGETLTENGPGMQARIQESPTAFFDPYPFERKSEAADAEFYHKPRWVHHIDGTARTHVTAFYQKVLSPGFRVLDLMSSWVSHLPDHLRGLETIGLGMNAEELRANPALSQFVVQDLNRSPILPFADGFFDAVICTSSVEYLTRPIEVFTEVGRVLKTGGLFLNTFSDRWFPPKVITLWEELHPFERMGLVLEFYRKSGRFTDLQTESLRGDVRPADDPYAGIKAVSDPVFAVWGKRA